MGKLYINGKKKRRALKNPVRQRFAAILNEILMHIPFIIFARKHWEGPNDKKDWNVEVEYKFDGAITAYNFLGWLGFSLSIIKVENMERIFSHMEERIKELTLLLLYLTSWKENDLPGDIRRSWKGYPFEVLDELTDEDFIRGSIRSKSVYLTESGIKKAEELVKKYFGGMESN